MQCSSVVSRFVTFCSDCLLVDFLLVINLLLGDYGSADFSKLYICCVVNVQGITTVSYTHLTLPTKRIV